MQRDWTLRRYGMKKRNLLSIVMVIVLLIIGSLSKNQYVNGAELDTIHDHGNTDLLSMDVVLDDITGVLVFIECPTCGAMPTSYVEYEGYSSNYSQHVKNTYRDYTFTCAPRHGVVKYLMKSGSWENHSIAYLDMGCKNNTHTFRPYCTKCGFTKEDAKVSCPGGPHVAPAMMNFMQ